MLFSPLTYNYSYRLSHSLLYCQSLPLVKLTARNDFQKFYPLDYLIFLKQQKDFQRHPLYFAIASLSIQIMRQVKYRPRGQGAKNAFELSKEISKKPFFFKTIYNPVYALYIIETNKHSKSTKRSEFAIKSISSAFPNLCYSLAKRFRVKFTEKLTYLTLRMPLLSDFCRHFFDKVIERGSYFKEPGLYKVNKHFEKVG